MLEAAGIIALGSVNIDLQVRADRWPSAGETLLAGDFLMTGGGKAANVAFLARRLGVPSLLLARTGDDLFADHALQPLADAGVDLTWTRRVPGQSTALSMIVVRDDGDKAIILAPNANEAWDAHDAAEIERCIRETPDGSVLVLDLEAPVHVVQRAFRTCSTVLISSRPIPSNWG
jgi:ribokinase